MNFICVGHHQYISGEHELTLKRQSRLQQTTFIKISEKIRLDVSSESSARQRIHMKNQALFSSKDKTKKVKCRLLQFLFGALRVKIYILRSRCAHICFKGLLLTLLGSDKTYRIVFDS